MANCGVLICFFFIAFSSSSSVEGNRATCSSSANLEHGIFNPQDFASRYPRSFVIRVSGYSSRKVSVNEYGRRRIDAETDNSSERTQLPAPAPASWPSQAPNIGNGTRNDAEEQKKKKKKEERPAAVKWLVGTALGSVTGMLSAIVASLLFREIRGCVKRWHDKSDMKPWVFQRKIIDAKALAFLKAAVATESLELLGRGGSGSVYKATLETGRVVAIKKVLTLANSTKDCGRGGIDKDGENSFELSKSSLEIKAELDTLGKIRHINLVTLLAYIPLPTAHYLIYDYMENGSLHDALGKVREDTLELPWRTRLKIAKEVATGLKYLHFECSPTIVHCDLKPGNILLDADMVAHIGDFGLAKIIPDSFTHYTSRNMAGTVGYIPPEYHQVCRYSTRGDVYGFGVVLVVLLTGKEPTESLFPDVCTSMGNWVVNVLQSGEENMLGVLDPHLRGHGDEAAMKLALKVAYFCLSEDPVKRPTIGDVLVMLEQISAAS